MIKVTIYKNAKKNYVGMKLFGHAGFAAYGSDIVCAAVSALTLNTVNSIEAFTDDKIKCVSNEKSGLLAFKFLHKPGDRSELLLDSLILGLKQIRNDHRNEEYIHIIFKEV